MLEIIHRYRNDDVLSLIRLKRLVVPCETFIFFNIGGMGNVDKREASNAINGYGNAPSAISK